MAAYKRHIDTTSISPLTVARLSVYLRCVEQLQESGVKANRFPTAFEHRTFQIVVVLCPPSLCGVWTNRSGRFEATR